MYKIKYYLKLIKNMNYKNFFNTIDLIEQRSNKNKLFIMIDMFICSLKYGSGYVDYYTFNFEKLKKKERQTFITRTINNNYVKKFNDKEYFHVFNDKYEFNKKFNKYINRDYISLKNASLKEFEEFIKKHPTIVVKPLDSSCGKNVQFINTESYNTKSLYDRLIKNKQFLIEEPIIQSEELNKLNYSSVNTIRIVSFLKDDLVNILFSAIRIGKDNEKVDNFNHGGIMCVLNEEGIITTNAIDKNNEVFKVHPQTNTKFIGFKIPEFDKIIKLVKKAALIEKHVKYIAWDIALTNNGPIIVEANHIPGYDLYQNQEHLHDKKKGLKEKFDKIMLGSEK